MRDQLVCHPAMWKGHFPLHLVCRHFADPVAAPDLDGSVGIVCRLWVQKH